MESWIEDVIALILNYNTSAMTIECVDNLLKISSDLRIVVVDNCSTDGSLMKLYENYRENIRIRIIKNDKNVGYAQGNNVGIRFIRESFKDAKYVIVLNPDIVVKNEITLYKLKHVLENNNDYAVSSCQIILNDQWRGFEQFAWKFPDRKQLMWAGTFAQRLFLNGPNKTYDSLMLKNGVAEVDIVAGCFFMAKLDELKKISDFDERTFLYFEETILAKKLAGNNKREVVLIGEYVNHNHVEKDRALKDYRKKLFDRKCFQNAKMVYIEHYAEIPGIRNICKIINKVDYSLKALLYAGIIPAITKNR